MNIERIISKLRNITIHIAIKLKYSKQLEIGKKVYFRKGFKITIENGGKLIIGNHCFFNHDCSINCLGDMEIGAHSIFGENVKMYDHNHNYSNINKSILEQGMKIGYIKIGKHCWIGSNVTILSNVTIGDNVVIGANCLIYKSIPSNSIVKNHENLIIEQRK